MSVDQGFWARRRAGVEAEEAAERAVLEAEALAAEQAGREEKSDAEILAELNLPEPESLSVGDDFSGFMQAAVPDRLRRRALRVLWRSNPVLANVDALVDYGEDFTDSATVIENMQTAYQVGKGMLRHIEEMARQAAEEDRGEELADLEPNASDALTLEQGCTEVEASDMAQREAEVSTEAEAHDQLEEVQSAEIALPPRRMKFRVEENA